MNTRDLPKIELPLSDRARSITAPGTSSMRSKANALKDRGIKVINFAAGELSLDACPPMKAGAIDAVESRRNRYTPPIGLPQLREKLAESVSRRCGTLFTADEIAVTAGAKQALFNASMVLLNPGDEVIVPTPYWETFPTQIRLAGATAVCVDTHADQYRLTRRAVESVLTDRTRMIVINTPNNPTGTVYQREELLGIAKLAFDRQIWVVFDECYRHLVRHPHEHHNILSLFEPLRQQTVLVDSFSKSQAVTGWRVGYACAPAHVISAMHNLQGHTTSNPSSLSQYAALSTITSGSEAFIAEINQFLERQLTEARAFLDRIEGIAYAPPEGAFYLFVDVSGKLGRHYRGQRIRDVDHLAELLLTEAHVAVVPGAGCGDQNCIRISYAIEHEELAEGLMRLGQFIAEIDVD